MLETVAPERAAGRSTAYAWSPSLLVLGLLVLTLGLRLWSLNHVPPWLWWDEASQGLDARDLLHGQFQVFFERAQGKEPLYVYLTTPFVAAWDGEPFAVRLAGALLGGLMVPALYVTARAAWWRQPAAGTWAGLAAAGLWAGNFWPQSINRIGFQVNALPLPLTLAVCAWLNWTHRPSRRRALFFGLLAGLTLATYLAARITPLLWLGLYAALPAARRRRLGRTLWWAALAFGATVAPLAIYFLLRPGSVLQRTVDFADLYQAPTLAAQVNLLLQSGKSVLGGFLGWAGDPLPRHNIPNRPPFSVLTGALVGLGLLAALATIVLRRRAAAGTSQRAWTLLLWWGLLCAPAAFSASSNPHFPRLLGALPAALLLAAWPVAWLAERLARYRPGGRAALALLLAALLAVETARTGQAYFGAWAQLPELYTWFQGDMWAVGEQVAAGRGAIGIVPSDLSSGDGLAYLYPDARIWPVEAGPDLPAWLDARLRGAGRARVLTPSWAEEPYVHADPQGAVPFYLGREGAPSGERAYPGFRLLAYRLGPQPQFNAAGQTGLVDRTFGDGVTLSRVQWGAAYPNPDRNATTAAAGTPFWVVLEWQLEAARAGLRAAVDVVDAAGHRVASTEQPLVGEFSLSRPWQPGKAWRTYHLVQLPATQPPGPVWLEARVYRQESGAPLIPPGATARLSVPLAEAAAGPAAEPVSPAAASVDVPVTASFGPDLGLLGSARLPANVAPGQMLAVKLFWQVRGVTYNQQPLTLALGDGLASAQVSLPPGVPAGHVVHTYADLKLPATTPPGPQSLWLAAPGGTPVALGEVTVAGRPREFQAPTLARPWQANFGDVVELLGMDTAEEELKVAPGQVVTVTLAWRALRTPGTDLARFVHVLGPDRQPLAQRDGAPCNGTCPARSWLPGEVLVEQVRLRIPEDVPPGTYEVGTGWYDPATLTRLPAPAADGIVVLPVRVRVGPER